jgi:histidinol dehydrogenase
VALTRVFEDLAEARRELLSRRALGSGAVPDSMRARLREIFGRDLTPEQAVAEIIDAVRTTGDQAIRDYTARIDGQRLESLEVDRATWGRVARAGVDAATWAALELAAGEIRAFHEKARRNSWLDFKGDGTLGQVIRPLRRVGLYAPGGRAIYPSTVLMAAVPARVAGVDEIVLTSPTQPGGTVAPAVLAAAEIAGVDRVFGIGGAQAIGALAFGTESVPRVDKIVGPGNLFVVLAKRSVAGFVGIDGLPGPTECLIVADESADVPWLAADFLAQAEHDELAQPILLCTSRQLADRVLAEVARVVDSLPRRETILASLRNLGAIVVDPSLDALIDLANDFAPEHLSLAVADAWARLNQVRNAGGVFVGHLAAEAIGDYTAGPSHIMPTGGTARYSSPLNLDDFTKITSVFSFGPDEVRRLGPPAITIALAEGLQAHARAIQVRLEVLDERR